MKQYNYIAKEYPSRPRSKRLKEADGSGGSSGVSVISGGGNAGNIGTSDHGQLTGIVSTMDEYSEFARDIHLTAADADKLNSLTGLEIIKLTDSTVPTDENLYSALRTDKQIADSIGKLDDRFLRKDINDTAHGFITFEAGWMTEAPVRSAVYNVGWEVEEPMGFYITEAGTGWFTNLNVRGPILSNNIIGSPYFASGWTGFGTEYNLSKSSLELDFLTVRKSMNVYELVFNQIRGTNGSLLVSDENKIKTVEDYGGVWHCTIDDADNTVFMNFRIGDVIRCQTRDKLNIRYYMAEVLRVGDNWFEIAKTHLEGKDEPKEGDVIARWSNTVDIDRKGLIYLTSSDSHNPYLDVRYGDWNATVGTIKARLGRLDGINDPLFPELYGSVNNFGLYTNNFYGTGELILRSTGESVSRTFDILKDSITLGMNELREEVYVSKDNVLQNSTFLGGTTDFWEYENVVFPLTFGDNILLANGSMFSDVVSGALIVNDKLNNRTVLQVTNTTVLQRNASFSNRSAGKYAISFSYRPMVPYGAMSVGIEGSTMMVTVPLSDTSKWQRAEVTGDWDGTGDFMIQVKGGGIVNIVDISFADDRLTNAINAVKVEYDTKLSLKADGATLSSLRDEYDEFNRIVRRDYATQTWTATKIESEVGTIIDGKLSDYSTITQTSTMINNKVADLNLRQYATTTWTSSQIQNKVENLNLGQYATTIWTNSQITSAVSNKVNKNEVETVVDQRYDFLVVAIAERLESGEAVTEAFYKFDINCMSLNRRIEMGTGSNNNFQCVSGLSPDTKNAAFWAGSTWANQNSAKIKLNHDGSGWLANKNIMWSVPGDATFTGKFQSSDSGRRIVLDPSNADRLLSIYNGSSLLSKFGVEPDNNYAYMQIGADNDWRLQLTTAGLRYFDYNNNHIFSIGNAGVNKFMFYAAWPTQAEAYTGMAYKDSSGYIRVK